jgi:hypothetical protein
MFMQVIFVICVKLNNFIFFLVFQKILKQFLALKRNKFILGGLYYKTFFSHNYYNKQADLNKSSLLLKIQK